jgi:peptidylprolyl isomerase
MSKAKSGDKVKLHYTGKVKDGEVFGTSRDREPLEFSIGSGSMIRGVEEGIIGMEIGDRRSIEIEPDEAFGPRREELTVDMKKSEFPGDMTFTVGESIPLQRQNGNFILVMVKDVKEDAITLDANHPLAGRTLVFDVELLEIAS